MMLATWGASAELRMGKVNFVYEDYLGYICKWEWDYITFFWKVVSSNFKCNIVPMRIWEKIPDFLGEKCKIEIHD